MNPAAPGMSAIVTTSPSSIRPAPTPEELRKKAHARLADRIDLSRSRHKPLSILRAEAKRALEQFFDQEAHTLTRSDRDKLIEDVIAESVGFGPLEELFRDDAVKEILIVAATQVIGRKNDNWLPMSARFRDVEQFRAALARWAEIGESLAPGPDPIGAMDVRLPNGFRVIAVLPPNIMDQPPQVLLQRGMPVNTPAPASGGSMLGTMPTSSANLMNGVRPAPATPAGQSRIVKPGPSPSPTPLSVPNPPVASSVSGHESSVIPNSFVSHNRMSGPSSQTAMGSGGQSGIIGPQSQQNPAIDPFAKIRQRVTERIIMKFASAGVYDLNQIPLPELHRIVLAQVAEFCGGDKNGFDEATYDRLSLEILSGMNR